MNAVISGQARTALIIDGDALTSFDISAPEILVERSESDFRVLFGEATDLRFVSETDSAEIVNQLREDYFKTSSLDLALMLLDKDISQSKLLIAEVLDELLGEPSIGIYLESIFYAKPLPKNADTINALRISQDILPKTYRWLSELVKRQDDILKVRNIWDGIDAERFGDEQNRASFHAVLVHEGVFRELVRACGNLLEMNLLRLNIGKNELITSLPNYRSILLSMFKPFGQSRVSPEDMRLQKDEDERGISRREQRRQSFNREEVTYDREEVKNNVQGQINYITDALKRYDFAAAGRLTDELVTYQAERGEPIHVVKSLCQIAQNAKELELYEFQLELTERAREMEYSDSWTQAQFADALLRNERFDEALTAFDVAISFLGGNDTERDAVVRGGRAEVLKAQGKLDEASVVYQETMLSHPGDAVVASGYAEVLKAQGKLNRALKVYKELIAFHPGNIVVRNGYAEALKAEGKFDEALEIYQETMVYFASDVFTKCGYAGVLKEQGKLNEALEVYQVLMAAHYGKTVVRNGYAQVLKAQGKFDEALEVYKETMTAFPRNAIVRNGYAEVLKTQGKLDEALEVYRQTIVFHPEDVVVRNGYAGVLKTQGKLDEALKVYEETMVSHPYDSFAKCGYAEVLRARGELNKALDVYQETVISHPENVVARNGLSGVLIALGRYEEALETLSDKDPKSLSEWIGYHIRGMIMLKTGNLAEAVKIFEKGERNGPIPSERAYFRSGLAIARLRQGDFGEAKSLLDNVETPLLKPAINILLAHALGELEMYNEAKAAFNSYTNASISKLFTEYRSRGVFELATEVESRYVTSKVRHKPDAWLFEREEELLLALAP